MRIPAGAAEGCDLLTFRRRMGTILRGITDDQRR